MNKEFFSRLAEVSVQVPNNGMDFKNIDSVKVYRSVFEEQEVMTQNTLAHSEMPEGSSRGTHFIERMGSTQEMYLCQLFTDNPAARDFVFLSVKFDALHQPIGVGPSYFGKYSPERKRIQFIHLMKPSRSGRNFLLQKKGRRINLYFFLANSIPESDATLSYFPIQLEAIVDGEFNKIGGNKPMIISIDELFHDPLALRFHLVKTLHF